MGTTVDSLLTRGYFPKELPPPFTTTKFAEIINKNSPPSSFRDEKRITRMMTHSLARAGNSRRRLGIPNPLTYLLLCEAIETNYTAIRTHFSKSDFSQSKPIEDQPRAFLPSSSLGELVQLRAETRATGAVLLRGDLSNFYHSIYSHSIPWALHSKNTAKLDRSSALFGNRLDQRIRNMQDGQTIGIPVGPDTSLIIAEIIASAIDAKLQSLMPNLRGFRYYDDFEFIFNSTSDAEKALSILETILSEYELLLHPTKSGIFKLPQLLEQEWIAVLRSLPIRENGQGQRVDILSFFDQLFRLIVKYPSDHVVSFAIGRLIDDLPIIEHWNLVEPLLFQSVCSQSNALPEFFYCLVASRDSGNSIDNKRLEELLNLLIIRNAPLNHGSEVAWSLWGILAFGLKVHSDAASRIGTMEDSIIALLALDAKNTGLVDPCLDTSIWARFMQTDELFGEQWLLAYEASVQGWLPTVSGADHVNSNPDFGFLRQHNCQFYQRVTSPVKLESLAAWKPNPGEYK